MNATLHQVAMAVAIPLLLTACGDELGNTQSALSVFITDAPACGFDHVYVTIERVRVHASTAATANDSGWEDITPPLPMKIDLLALSNGLTLTLGKTLLPATDYHQLRLVLAENTATKMANTIVPTGGNEQPLHSINTVRDGLTIIRTITINPDSLTELVLDFDACLSIVPRGDGSYGLKPVITSTPMHSSGGITGYVSTAQAGAAVYAELNGVIIKGTRADSSGRFVLAPVPQSSTAANYDVVIVHDHYTTGIITGVPVNAGAGTAISTAANPIVLPDSVMQSVSGTVSPASALATLYAKQIINGKRYTSRLVNANADTGTWGLSLAGAAPVLANFGPLPLTFAANDAVAGQYTMSAVPTVGTSQNSIADISAGDVTNVDVSF